MSSYNTTAENHPCLPAGKARKNRYDVTVLVNGLPMAHAELKRRGHS